MTSIGLEDALAHAGTIRSKTPLTVESSPEQWAYATSLRLVLGNDAPEPVKLPLKLSVSVKVESGELGCLLVAEDWTTLVGSVPSAARRGHHVVDLIWESGDGIAHLVFRNHGGSGQPCVFTVESVELSSAPAGPFAHSTNLLVTHDSLSVHGSTTAVGDLEFMTVDTQWSYAVSLPIAIAETPDPGLLALVVVELQVFEGSVGVGVLDHAKQRYLTTEVDMVAAERPARTELRLEVSGLRGHVMVRNTAAGRPSRFKVLGLLLQFAPTARALLRPVPPPDVPARIHRAPAITGVFDILISHSSRRWFAEQCDRSLLRDRYARPERLRDLPPFDALPPIAAPYHGLLSVFRLELSPGGVTGRVLRHYLSAEKVVHATVVGEQVVVCLDTGIATFPQRPEANWVIDSAAAERIVDPWFGGLHTVVAVDERTCLVSSSGADAVLWVDVERKEVTRRWRLPSDRYGINYALDPDTWLAEHYISNDIQLGHLNCAAPDGHGGVFISVLGQGDIGHLDSSGHYELLVTGFIGCHGVRYDVDRDLLYFCDSCGGTLMRVDGPGRTTTLFDAGSRWLHDAVHLSGGLFLLTVADRNQVVLADTDSGRALAEWDFSAVEGTVQFLSDASP